MNSETMQLIESLGLSEHPEGGYYRETYRSSTAVGGEQIQKTFDGARSASTAIYFLLDGSQFSTFHRIKSDEMLHFYKGGAVLVYEIDPAGVLREIRLGSRPDQGEHFQALIPAGCWFALAPEDPSGFALIGCTVAPGFEFKDFEVAKRAALIEQHPKHRELINRLTKE